MVFWHRPLLVSSPSSMENCVWSSASAFSTLLNLDRVKTQDVVSAATPEMQFSYCHILLDWGIWYEYFIYSNSFVEQQHFRMSPGNKVLAIHQRASVHKEIDSIAVSLFTNSIIRQDPKTALMLRRGVRAARALSTKRLEIIHSFVDTIWLSKPKSVEIPSFPKD